MEFRKGDKVKPRGEMIVTNVHAGHIEFADTGYLPAHLFELVERPGPRLEDLPDGIVVRRADGMSCHKLGAKLLNLANINSWWPISQCAHWEFTVIGALPDDTPAWDLYARALRDTEGVPEDVGEWWVES